MGGNTTPLFSCRINKAAQSHLRVAGLSPAGQKIRPCGFADNFRNPASVGVRLVSLKKRLGREMN
jgi:hypothetical protein